MNVSFTQLTIAGNFLQFVKDFKYLGHVMTTCNARFVVCLQEPAYLLVALHSVRVLSKLPCLSVTPTSIQ